MTLQETIIAQLGVKPSIDPKEEIRKSVDFLKAYMLKHPFLKTYVLGISGGQDSTLAGRLAQRESQRAFHKRTASMVACPARTTRGRTNETEREPVL